MPEFHGNGQCGLARFILADLASVGEKQQDAFAPSEPRPYLFISAVNHFTRITNTNVANYARKRRVFHSAHAAVRDRTRRLQMEFPTAKIPGGRGATRLPFAVGRRFCPCGSTAAWWTSKSALPTVPVRKHCGSSYFTRITNTNVANGGMGVAPGLKSGETTFKGVPPAKLSAVAVPNVSMPPVCPLAVPARGKRPLVL